MNNKYLNFFLLTTTFLITLILVISCDDSLNEPEEPPPGSRDYTWEVDTLTAPFWKPTDIWGAKPNDVWLIGSAFSCQEQVFHYDGTKWELHKQCFFGPKTIFGFSESEIWMGANEGKIYFYNGNSWNNFFTYSPASEGTTIITNVWGHSSNNVYAVGVQFSNEQNNTRSFILHYDGRDWKQVYFANDLSYYLKIFPHDSHPNKYYVFEIEIIVMGADEKFVISIFDGQTVTEIYRKDLAEIGSFMALQKIGSDIYYYTKKELGSLKNSSLQKDFTISESNFNFGVWGRNKNDLFLSLWDGIIHHNGNDFKRVLDFDYDVNLSAAQIFNNEMFFTGFKRGSFTSLVYKGTLN